MLLNVIKCYLLNQQYYQIESAAANSILKRLYIMAKWDFSQECKGGSMLESQSI